MSTIYLHGHDSTIKEAQLVTLFSGYGVIDKINMVEKEASRFAFISFISPNAAPRAVALFEELDLEWNFTRLTVRIAQKSKSFSSRKQVNTRGYRNNQDAFSVSTAASFLGPVLSQPGPSSMAPLKMTDQEMCAYISSFTLLFFQKWVSSLEASYVAETLHPKSTYDILCDSPLTLAAVQLHLQSANPGSFPIFRDWTDRARMFQDIFSGSLEDDSMADALDGI